MKFTIIQSKLVGPLQLISGAVEKRQTLPVLANLLIKIEKGLLSITATDLEIEMSVNINLENDSLDGDITVPARKLVDICRSLPVDGVINIELLDSKLIVKCGRSKFTLSTISAQEFPNIEDSLFSTEFVISSSDFKRTIDKTQFAMAQQDVRYYLNGMLIELDQDKLLTVATDGHRLALSRLTLNAKVCDDLVQVIIPRKGVLEAGKLLSSIDEEATVSLNSNHIRITIGQFVFTSKLVDGRFPDYGKVLPKNAERILLCEKESIKEAFSRASILCNDKFRGVRLTLSENKLTINANNPEQEEAEIELDVEYNDKEMEIGFNVSYLLDAVNAIKSDKVKFCLGDSNSSVLIEASEDADSAYVVMPMRL
ncbi:MAG: DNA polymerase III subunit beta [Kangiella sp.]|nr:MAG: DNA polymerase III subunit beta [Kangiella sp.]